MAPSPSRPTHERRPQVGTARALVPAVAAAVFAAILTGGVANADAATPGADVPAVRRVLVAPDRLTEELGRVPEGTLAPLTRRDFETRLRRARRAAETLSNPPRLVAANYAARLVDGGIVGNADWRVVNPSPDAGILTLAPFNLAVRKARVRKGQADWSDALLAKFDARNFGLLVQQPGAADVQLVWSARGLPFPGGVRFDLRLPACAIASLELTLPADYTPELGDLFPVSGPLATEAEGQYRWRVPFGGHSQLDLVIRKPTEAGRAVAMLAKVRARHDVEPDVVRAEFDVELEVPEAGARDFRFECDPDLRPLEVAAANVESWEARPGATPEQPSQLSLRLRKPFRGGTLSVRISATAPLPADRQWQCPQIRVPDAVTRDESLTLRVHPELRLEEWQSGDFSLVPLDASSAADGRGRGDPWQRIELRRNATPPGRTPTRPRAFIRAQRPEFRVRQFDWWRVESGAETLTTRLQYEMTRGALFQVPVALPAGWDVQSVTTAPANLIRNWWVRHDTNGAVLLVELRRPLGRSRTEAGAAQVTLELRKSSNAEAPGAEKRLALQPAEPLGAASRDGAIGVSVNTALQWQIEPSVDSVPPPENGPWDAGTLDFSTAYHSRPPAATLLYWPRPVDLDARCTVDVNASPAGAAGRVQVLLRPNRGAPTAVDLAVTGTHPADWKWVNRGGRNGVKDFRRQRTAEVARLVSLLGNLSLAGVTGTLASQDWQAQEWRLVLMQPLREALLLEASFTLDTRRGVSGANREPWTLRVPVVSIRTTGHMDGEVRLRHSGVDLTQTRGDGLSAGSREAPGRPVSRLPIYRYASAAAVLEFVCRDSGETATSAQPTTPRCDRAVLSTSVERHKLLQRFRFEFSGWSQRSFPVRLPEGVRAIGARVDEHWVPRFDVTASGRTTVVEVPVPAPVAALHRAELICESPPPNWTFLATITPPVPQLPIATVAFRHTWWLPPDVMPLFTDRVHCPSGQPPGPDDGRVILKRTSQVAADELDSIASPNEGSEETRRFAPPEPMPGGAGWTEWEVRPGWSAEDALVIFRRGTAEAAGWAAACAVALVLWHARRSRVYAHLLTALLALAGLAALWLPDSVDVIGWYPLLATSAAGLVTHGFAPLGLARVPGKKLGIILLLIGVASAARAVTVKPFFVFIVGRADEPWDKQTVLAPPALLKQMEALTSIAAAGPREPVLTAATYDATVSAGTVEFRARFQAYSLAEGTASLLLPLGGIRVREARCDGTECPLAIPEPPREGYEVSLPGRGHHEVEVYFAAPIQQPGGEREILVGVPQLAQSRLTVSAADGSRPMYAVTCRGVQSATPATAVRAGSQMRLEADLGAIALLHVRWRAPNVDKAPAPTQVREGYLWHLEPTKSTLFAVLQYTAAGWPEDRYVLAVPNELELHRVEAARLPGAATEEPAPRLRDWSLTEGGSRRRLELSLYRPAHHGVQFSLEFVPRQPLPAETVLPLPSPEGAVTTEGLLAYRAEAVRVQPKRHLGISGEGRTNFVKFWRAASLDEPGPDLHAYRFVRAAGTPVLQVALEAPPVRIDTTASVVWTAAGNETSLAAAIRLAAPRPELFLIECEVPAALQDLEVAGPNVRSWSRQGTRVQVWLRRAVAAAELRVTGVFRAARAGVRRFSVVPVRVAGAGPGATRVRVEAEAGYRLEALRLNRLKPLPDTRGSPEAFDYLADSEDYGAEFAMDPSLAAAGRVLTLAEWENRKVAMTVLAAVWPRGDSPIVVRLRNWRGGPVRAEAAGASVRPLTARAAASQAWVLAPDEGGAKQIRFQLSGSVPVDGTSALSLPDVQVEGTSEPEQWVAVGESNLILDSWAGLSAPVDVAPLEDVWPLEVQRLRRSATARRVVAKDWSLLVRPLPTFGRAPAVEVVRSEMAAAAVDGRSWTYQATYDIYQSARADLGLTLPISARLLHVDLDGVPLTVVADGPHVEFPLPESFGAHTVHVSWTYDDPPSFARPRFETPTVDQLTAPPPVWAVSLPPGYRAIAEKPGAATLSGADVADGRAEAQLRICEILGEQLRAGSSENLAAQLLAAQRRFLSQLRQLAAFTSAADARVRALKDRNERLNADLGIDRLLERVRNAEAAAGPEAGPGVGADTAATADTGLFEGHGTPSYWTTSADEPVLRLRLLPPDGRQTSITWLKSFLLLAALAGVELLARAPRLRAVADRCRPEALALAAGLGCVIFGPRWAFAALAFFALWARLLPLGAWAVGAVRRGTRSRPGVVSS